MTHLIKNKERLKRLLCLLVVWAMTLSLIPAPASAADDSIKLTSCDFTSISYHSEVLGNASIHTIDNACCQGEFFAAILLYSDTNSELFFSCYKNRKLSDFLV